MLLLYLVIFFSFNNIVIPQTSKLSLIKKTFSKAEILKNVFPDSSVFHFQKTILRIDSCLSLNKSENTDSLLIYKILSKERIGKIFHQQNKFFLAQNYYQDALNAAKEIEHDSLTAENYFNLGEICLENGSYLDAINNYKDALKLYKSIKYTEGVYWTDIGLGIIYRKCGNSELSKYYYEKAIEIGKKKKDPFYLAVAYNNLGNLNRQMGSYEKAREYLQISLEQCKAAGNPLYIADCNHSLGDLLKEYKDYERALEYYKTALDLAEKQNDEYRLFSYYASIASVYLLLDKNEDALFNFSKSMELAKSVGDKGRLSEILLLISEFFNKNHEFESTNKNLNKALSIAEEIGDSISIASALLEITKLNYNKKKYDFALNNATRAFDISTQKEFFKIKEESALYLSKIYSYKKNYENAYKYFKIHSAINDSLINVEKIKVIEETEAKYNLAQMEKEKLSAANEALLSETKLNNRNLILSLLAIFTIFTLVYLIRYIVKRRKEKEINEQKSKRLKHKIDIMQSQLDAKNRELTTKAMLISDNNKIFEEISEVIGDYLEGGSDEKNELRKLRNNLKDSYKEKHWEDFVKHFEEVHPNFYKKLLELNSHLSPNEQKICAFLRMNLNTKEVAQITHQSIKGIEVARSRIRKKIDLPKEESLTGYLQKI
ncbi:MAG: tetratricopeptide repeat protein [Melioribacteraceae bacterium]|nr:tetratricopeptide repeat protein [Melioribacteraceae bacterium]